MPVVLADILFVLKLTDERGDRGLYTKQFTEMRSECKVSRIVIAKVLNHADRGVTAIYEQSSYDDEKRVALEFWGAHVIDITSSGP